MTSSHFGAVLDSPSIHLNRDSSKGFSTIAPHVDVEKLRYIYVMHGKLVITVGGIDFIVSADIGMFFDPRKLHSAQLASQCAEIKVITLIE